MKNNNHTVILIGRANVGKSTLFNALTKSQVAITDPTPGVTRDGTSGWWKSKGRVMRLIDTGGFQSDRDEIANAEIVDEVTARNWGLIAECSVVLFVVDGKQITAFDHELAKQLRSYHRKIVVVVNKVDNQRIEQGVGEFYALGYPTVVGVSAVHRKQLGLIGAAVHAVIQQRGDSVRGGATRADSATSDVALEDSATSDATVPNSAATIHHTAGAMRHKEATVDSESAKPAVSNAEISADGGVEMASGGDTPMYDYDGRQHTAGGATDECVVAIVGKPNSGKSTLMNTLSNMNISIVNSEAGTTRDTIAHHKTLTTKDQQLGVVLNDTAGLRRKTNVIDAIEYYSTVRTYRAIAQSHIIVLMCDATESFTNQDKKIAEYAAARGLGIIRILNKSDLLPVANRNKAVLFDAIHRKFPHLLYAPLVLGSALNGDGIQQVKTHIAMIWKQLNTKISTPRLNAFLKEKFSHVYISRLKLRYATQTGTAPLAITIFVNFIKYIPNTFPLYLANQLRSDFAIENIPILITFKDNRRDNRRDKLGNNQSGREKDTLRGSQRSIRGENKRNNALEKRSANR